MSFLGVLIADLRYGSRMLAKNPGFSLVVILTLGLGIGLNSALFSIADGALLRDPPVKNPGQLVVLMLEDPNAGSGQNQASALEFSALRQQGQSFQGVVAAAYQNAAMSERGESELVTAARVTPNYFDVFGTEALIGRTLSPSEDAINLQSEAVISYDLWQRRFSHDPEVVGIKVFLGGQSYKIIGIMP